MNKKNIENKIKNAFEAVTPAKLDDVLGCCAEQMAENREKKAPVTVPLPRRNRVRWAQAGALALVAICVSTAFIFNGRRANEIIIGSTDTQNKESVIATHSDSSSESVYVTESESDSVAGTTVESTDEPVSEPSSATEPNTEPDTDTIVEPPVYTDPIVEPTEITVHEPTEEPTENVVIEPTEVIVPEPTEATRPEVTEEPGVATDSETSSANTGESYFPVPDPEYRELRGAISDALRQLSDKTGNPQYHRKDEVYVCAWLGESDGESVYYISFCVGKHRIDCKVPVIYKNEITDFTITTLVERGSGETGYIGSDTAKSLALTAAGVSEGFVDALSVSIDRFKEHPSYHVTFYYNGSRYFYDLDAVSGKLLFQNVYDLTALKKFIKEQQEDPYYFEPELLSDDLLFDRIVTVRSAANTHRNSDLADALAIERNVKDDILNIYLKNDTFICRGELTCTDGYLICYEESSADAIDDNMLSFGDLRDAMIGAGISTKDVLELTAEHNGRTFDIIVKTKENVYKIGVWGGDRPLKSASGNITYFGKAPVGKEAEMELMTADSALQKALDDAGVTEYTLVENESIKLALDRRTVRRHIYYFDITFKSGEYTYKYKVDLFTGKAEKYLSGSGKGDVSDVVYSIGDHTGWSKKEITSICNAVKREFSAWFDGCKLDVIWYDDKSLSGLHEKYSDYFYANYGIIVGIRFTTGADYNGNYGLKPNTEYEMYCLLFNYFQVRWEAIGYVFE